MVTQKPRSEGDPLRNFVGGSLPAAAMAHSFLVDLQWDPAFRADKTLEPFADNALHELHHLMGLWGALLRTERGDPTAWTSVGLNLARLLYRRRMTMELWQQLSPALRNDPRAESIFACIEEGNQLIQRNWPALLQVLSAGGWTGAAPNSFN